MAQWNKNNRACKTTWSTLRSLKQNMKVFDESGTVKMSELAFWNDLATVEMRSQQARTLAHEVDNKFRNVRLAEFEAGVQLEEAIEGLHGVLTSESKTVADLADVADALYKFLQED